MICPYCGNLDTVSVEGKFREYHCSRCDYLFEVNTARVILDKILSIPFSSLLYSPIIITGTYYLAKVSYDEESLLSFGYFYAFLMLLWGFVALFTLFIISERRSQIFIIKERKNLFHAIKDASPLLKMGVIYVLTAISIPFFYL